MPYWQLVGDAVVVHQPACRLPQRRIAERGLFRVFGVKAEVINQARRESVDTHVCIVFQRRNLIRAKLIGDNAFPQNFQANPTDTIGAITLMAAQAIKEQYLKNPGPLVQA